MNYELAKKLKNHGYPQILIDAQTYEGMQASLRADEARLNNGERIHIPTLEELIDACIEEDDKFWLYYSGGWWNASVLKAKFKRDNPIERMDSNKIDAKGKGRKEAVANLFLKVKEVELINN